MGIQYYSYVIIGFRLDYDFVVKWIQKHEKNFGSDPYYIFRNLYENKVTETDTFKIDIIRCRPYYDCSRDDDNYHLTFVYKGEDGLAINKLSEITPELLELMKKIYKDIMKTKLKINSVQELPIYSDYDVS